VGILINFIGIDPIKALIYSAIANGIIAPIIIICIVHISSSQKIMGEFKNKKFTNIVGWTIVGLMSLAAIATVVAIFL
jgi:Mn2+/Fe2+ NRAMP family transporter